MKNNTQGLFSFGQPVDARAADARALQQFQEQALMQARLTPLQQVSYMNQVAGHQLGSALGRMMGGRTDAEVKAEKDNQIWQQMWDESNPAASYVNLAQYLESQGRFQEADAARRQGIQVMNQQQQMTQAQQKQAEMQAQAGVNESLANVADASTWTPEQQLTVELANAAPHQRGAIIQRMQQQAAEVKAQEAEAKRKANVSKLIEAHYPNASPALRQMALEDPQIANKLLTGIVSEQIGRKESALRVAEHDAKARINQRNKAPGGMAALSDAGGGDGSAAPLDEKAQSAIDEIDATLGVIRDQEAEATTWAPFGGLDSDPSTVFNPLAATTGFVGSIARNIRGTPAYDFASRNETLKARASFTTLADMRANSPTGGALGSITEGELKLLEASVANMETAQSKDQYLRALNDYKTRLQAIRDKIAKAPNRNRPGPTRERASGGSGATSGAAGGANRTVDFNSLK